MIRPKKTFALLHFIEPLIHHRTYATRRMFGCLAIYLHDRNMLVLAENPEEKDWNGVLIPTFREHHASLRESFAPLVQHAILGKWLYLSIRHPDFESTLESLVRAALKNDPRIGIEAVGKEKKKKPGFRNLGPQSKAALKKAGIETPEQLKKAGWKRAVLRVMAQQPDFLNVNFIVAIDGAIEDRDWRSYSAKEKAPFVAWAKDQRNTRKKMPLK